MEKRHIFISHNSKDSNKISELVKSLKLLGCSVFYSSNSSTNLIEFGEDFYKRIRVEIEKSDLVIFMVSDNFYKSIPSLIEVGMAYSMKKKMIPVSFKSGKYKEDLRGVFNTNLRLASLDDLNDIVNILNKSSESTDVSEILECAKNIMESIEHMEEVSSNREGAWVKTTITVDEMSEAYNQINVEDKILRVVDKFNRIQKFDYIMIKYIVEQRVYNFSFEEDWSHWTGSFNEWLSDECICLKTNSFSFLEYLNRLNLLRNSIDSAEIKPEGIDAIEYIYDRDIEKINSVVNENIVVF